MLTRLLRYFGGLTKGRVILWCYAIWWIVNVTQHFDPSPRLWITSLGLSGIIGVALCISTRSSTNGTTEPDGWQVFRLFLMPLCVSSFAALVKDAGYLLIFPPTIRENLVGLGCITLFLLMVAGLRRWVSSSEIAAGTAHQEIR